MSNKETEYKLFLHKYCRPYANISFALHILFHICYCKSLYAFDKFPLEAIGSALYYDIIKRMNYFLSNIKSYI